MAPAFEHHAQLPVERLGGFEVTVFAGSLAGATSPARVYSPVVGAQIHVTLTGQAGTRLFLLGGEPMRETLLMWWNFVGRTPQDIIDAAHAWADGQRFGQVHGYRGAPLAVPPLDAVRLARRT